MSPIIHAEIGWLTAQPLMSRRDRIIVTLLSLFPDLDGLGILFGDDLYYAFHHRLCHGWPAALLVATVAGLLTRSGRATALTVAAFHLHVLADLVGSGPGWPVFYLWPLSEAGWLPSWQWELASWQNSVIGLAVTLTALGCALWLGRTPVELFSRRWDARVVQTVRRRFGRA